MEWKKEVIESQNSRIENLDISILNDFVFKKILKIENIRNDARISYISGDKGMENIAKKMQQTPSIVFLLFPIAATDFIDIVDNEGVMPPKSTYFLPRISNAFVTLMFE